MATQKVVLKDDLKFGPVTIEKEDFDAEVHEAYDPAKHDQKPEPKPVKANGNGGQKPAANGGQKPAAAAPGDGPDSGGKAST